ncbi:uncharacterized protein BYT42DRAFT_643315 [Radiomyces spectabilis]|uniref:uncharacterized protein n=1 Tax=Radiomyces spectabilis TaxID=64574 RepID=UPI002220653B|nr:uncharacterized protein BYT42DRAFT_643315 [Radiomyces spectabilis]KAI8384515.1 hypothetical protein BYT42DRAFT_643315 [Radiomyces spectabilis]
MPASRHTKKSKRLLLLHLPSLAPSSRIAQSQYSEGRAPTTALPARPKTSPATLLPMQQVEGGEKLSAGSSNENNTGCVSQQDQGAEGLAYLISVGSFKEYDTVEDAQDQFVAIAINANVSPSAR